MKASKILSFTFSFALLIIWIHVLFNGNHKLYDGTSITYALFASIILTILSYNKSAVTIVICILANLFMTQRIITTYIFPEEFDYYDYVGFSHLQIQRSTQFFFGITFALLLGTIVFNGIFKGFKKGPKVTSVNLVDTNFAKISYFGLEVNFLSLIRTLNYIIIPLLVFKIINIFRSGFGLTGSVYDSDQTFLKWFQIIPVYCSSFAVFAFFYFEKKHPIKRQVSFVFALVVLNGLILTSKGLILSFLFFYFLITLLRGNKISRNFVWISISLIVISLLIFFPLMQFLRSSLLSNAVSLSFSLNDYLASFRETLFLFLNRVSLFESTTLWLTVPDAEIPRNASLMGEFIELINKFAIGEIIPQPDSINLSKMMVVIGRGYGNVYEMGGHAENLGIYAVSYLYFGFIGAIIYMFFWVLFCLIIEHLRIHIFHKVTILYSLLVGGLIGASTLIIDFAFFWYILCTIFIIGLMKIYSIIFGVKKIELVVSKKPKTS